MSRVRIDGVVYESVDGYIGHDIHSIPQLYVSNGPAAMHLAYPNTGDIPHIPVKGHLGATANKADVYFLETLYRLLRKEYSTQEHGTASKWEDGTPAHTYFNTAVKYEYDLSAGEFPFVTIRPQAWKSAIKEIFWIYQDQSNDLKLLREKYGITWWDKFDIGDGTIGHRYGYTVKKYNLISKVIDKLSTDKMNRRIMMNLWQETDINETPGLPPCAFLTQWIVRGEYLDLILTQRSSDFATAWSINQIQYVALQMMLAKVAGLKPGKFIHMVGNVHVYDRHLDACDILKTRQPSTDKPILIFEPKGENFLDFTIDDFRVENYNPNKEQVKLEIAIGG